MNLWERSKNMKGKKYFMVDYYILNKVLGRIKEVIGIKKFDNNKTLINTANKLPHYITLT